MKLSEEDEKQILAIRDTPTMRHLLWLSREIGQAMDKQPSRSVSGQQKIRDWLLGRAAYNIGDELIPLLKRIAEAAERIADNDNALPVSKEDAEVEARLEEEKRKLQEQLDDIRLLEERERVRDERK